MTLKKTWKKSKGYVVSFYATWCKYFKLNGHKCINYHLFYPFYSKLKAGEWSNLTIKLANAYMNHNFLALKSDKNVAGSWYL